MSFTFVDLDPDVTKASREELKAYLKWMNKHGTYPIIIGGWAVYGYTRGLMSQDIDAVVYDQQAADYILEDDYFQTNGYKMYNQGLMRSHYIKQVYDSNGRPQPIRFDVFIATEKHTISELGIIKDWSLNVTHQEQTSIDGLDLYVPSLELLIVQKITAALERALDLKGERDMRTISWLKSKIKKDYIDVASLIKLRKLNKTYKDIVINCGVDKHLDNFVIGYRTQENSDIFPALQIDFNTVRNLLKV